MVHILKREFIDSFKSIRSILIVLFICYISYQSAQFLDKNPALMNTLIENNGETGSLYTASIVVIVILFGFLFAFAISHDMINRELETKTIRLLVTKISRLEIMLGKFLGTLLFWIVTISIAFLILSLIAGSFFPTDYLKSIIFLFYIISFVQLISTVILKTKLTMFLGILFGITLPIIGLIVTVSEKWYLTPFKYILPYNYIDGSLGFILIPLALGIVFFLLAVWIMKRRDL